MQINTSICNETIELHMDIKDFSAKIFSSAFSESQHNNTSIEIELARKYLDIMSKYGEIVSYEICPFKKNHASLTAYSYNEELDYLDLFLFYKPTSIIGKISIDDVHEKYDSLNYFYRESLRNAPFYGASLNCEVKSAINLIKETKDKVKRVRLYFLTYGIVDSSSSPDFSEVIENVTIDYMTWDITRFYRINSLNYGDTTIEIDFLLNLKKKIQCLRVEDENPKIDAYFAIMPGDILAKIYNQYKQSLMENNVRLYLQKNNNVNRQICKTIKERPEMFFSFNNGISATAKQVEFGSGGSKTAPFITKIKDLQIVNGGQTTATIAAMQEYDLSKVFVPMKISVIKDSEKYSEIVKDISTSANSQTAVKRSDFLSGDEYLLRIDSISKQEIEPYSKTKWYFERKRGQYKNELMNLLGYDKTLFNVTYPKNQIIDKSELAKLATLWDMKPYIACKSKEIVTITYFSSLNEENTANIGSIFYRNIVSLHLLYNEIYNYIKNDYPRLFGTYINRITIYTISSIAYITEKQFDLSYIWTNQKVQDGILKTIKPIISLIHKHLYVYNYQPNYYKDSTCWDELKEKLNNMEDVKYTIKNVCEQSLALNNRLSEEEKIINKAISTPAAVWKAIGEWGKKTGNLSMAERLRVANYSIRYRALEIFKNVNTAKRALELEEKARSLGFSTDIEM